MDGAGPLGVVLVVGVLGGELVELTDDGDLLLDGCLDLCYQRRIATAGCRVNAGEKGLGRGDGTLKALDDLGQRLADLGFLLQLVFEIIKDGGVQ